MLLPGEGILEDAKQFSYKFLKEKQAANEILDKWIITKDLPGEVCICVILIILLYLLINGFGR